MFGFGKKKLRQMDLRDPNFNFDVYARIYCVDSFYDIWTLEQNQAAAAKLVSTVESVELDPFEMCKLVY